MPTDIPRYKCVLPAALLLLAALLQLGLGMPAIAEPAHGATQASLTQELEENATAIVLDFENGTGAKLSSSVRKALALKFADKLDQQDAFATVLTEGQSKKIKKVSDESSVVVVGVVTKYRKESANIRILVGVEEGISFFDARVHLNPKKNSDGLRQGKVDTITIVEDTLVAAARDKGESVREYVEDAAQILARAYRAKSKARRKRIS